MNYPIFQFFFNGVEVIVELVRETHIDTRKSQTNLKYYVNLPNVV